MELTTSEQRHVDAAQGWLALGSPVEAFAELDNIEPAHRVHPDVLKTRWEAFRATKKWADAAEVARAIIEIVANDFDGWWMFSFAMHETGRTQEAYDSLVSVRGKFSGEYLLHYNLACYLTRLGQLDQARGSLKTAFVLNPKMRQQALDDPDLEPLRPELQRPK